MFSSLFGRARSSAIARRMRLSSKREPRQSGEAARRFTRYVSTIERTSSCSMNSSRSALRNLSFTTSMTSVSARWRMRGVKLERSRRAQFDVDFAGVEEKHFAIARLHDDGRIGLCSDLVLGRKLGKHKSSEAP